MRVANLEPERLRPTVTVDAEEFEAAKRMSMTALNAIGQLAAAWDEGDDNSAAPNLYYEGLRRGMRMARVQCANELGHLYNVLLQNGRNR